MFSSEKKTTSSGKRAVYQKGNPKHGKGASRSTFSSTVAKAIGIVDILASMGETGIGLVELSVLLEMPKSSTHRYLATLQELGLAERKDDDRYYLGIKVIELAGSFLTKSDLHNESQPIMEELAEKTGETVHLAVPSGTEVVYIAKIESRYALTMSSHIGSRQPMYSTSLGKAILAFSKPKLVRSILTGELQPRTSHTITSIEALRAELATVRSQGFALDKEENELGICCVGAPVLDYSSTAIAAISISGPCERMTPDRAVELGHLLWESTQRISRRRGFSGQMPGLDADTDAR